MKKAFAILLVLAIAMVGVFADPTPVLSTSNVLTIQYQIDETFTPGFKWSYSAHGGTAATSTIIDGSALSTDNAFVADIAAGTDAGPVSVGSNALGTMTAGYVAIRISDASAYSISDSHGATISVTASNWTNGQTANANNTNNVSVGTMVAATVQASDKVTLSVSNDNELVVAYSPNAVIDRSSSGFLPIGYVAAYWPEKTNMDHGTYTAQITISYTAL